MCQVIYVGETAMKILHTADIHLTEENDERWKTLQQLIEIGKKEKIDIFAISGDLFDKDIDAEKLRPIIREIFSNTGFKIIIIPGNHDIDSYSSGLHFGEDLFILTDHEVPFEYNDVVIWGMPFEKIEEKEIQSRLRLLKTNLDTNKTNILLYHGELLDAFFFRGDFGDEGNERYMPLKISYFKDLKIDYILGGHFHTSFDKRMLENGGYFCYPGSPISITKRETGRRKVNLFEVGKPPNEYSMDSPHFEKINIVLDPYNTDNPKEILKKGLKNTHSNAKIILTVKGYINSEAIGISEKELIKQMKKIASKICIEDHYPFYDISRILEDDLFNNFIKKLEGSDYKVDEKKQMRDLAIRAMMEIK